MATTLALVIASGGCSPSQPVPSGSSAPSAAASPPVAASHPALAGVVPDWRTNDDEPYPFTTPVPPLAATPIDGTYTRVPTDPYEGERIPCRRCPPYPLDRGASTLTLADGRFHMAHALPEYRTLGHVTVSPSHIELFNDIECSDVRGRYRWRLDGDALTFEVVDDPCAFGQRARDLTAVAWRLAGEPQASQPDECYPPNEEAGITGHWPIPSGC